jgi:beta-alanine degradation protein BauB
MTLMRKPPIPFIPAKAGIHHRRRWIPAFAVMSGILLAGASFAEALPDPLEAGWKGEKVCEVMQETDTLRMLKCTFAPGVGHERHFHAPHVGLILKGGRMRITDPSGTVVRDLPTGGSWKSDGVDWHEAVNIGMTTAIYIIIEDKTR